MSKDNFDLIIEFLGDSGINTTTLAAFHAELMGVHQSVTQEINKL